MYKVVIVVHMYLQFPFQGLQGSFNTKHIQDIKTLFLLNELRILQIYEHKSGQM